MSPPTMRDFSGVVSVAMTLLLWLASSAPVLAEARGLFIVVPDFQPQVIALTKEAGGDFDKIHYYTVNASDAVAFTATSEGKVGLYLHERGRLTLVAKEGQPIPGDFGRTFGPGFSVGLSDSGLLLIAASVSGNLGGIFLYSEGTLSTLILTGQITPERRLVTSLQALRITEAGIFFKANSFFWSGMYKYNLSTKTYSSVFNSDTSVAGKVPATPVGVWEVITGRGARSEDQPLINQRGDMAIRFDPSRLALYSNGQLRKVVEAGDERPSALGGGTFGQVDGSRVWLTGSGAVFFSDHTGGTYYYDGTFRALSASRPPIVSGVLDSIIFDGVAWVSKDGVVNSSPGGLSQSLQSTPGNFALLVSSTSGIGLLGAKNGLFYSIASQGTPTPGGGGITAMLCCGPDSGSIYNSASINGFGDVAFKAGVLGGPGLVEVFRFKNNQLKLVFYEGQRHDFGTLGSIGHNLKLGDSGSIVFEAGVTVNSMSSSSQSLIPHFGSGPGVVSTLVLANPSSNKTATGTITSFDDNGLPLKFSLGAAPEAFQTAFSIPPLGLLSLTTQSASIGQFGSVFVASDSKIGSSVVFDVDGLGSAGVGTGNPGVRFMVPVFRDLNNYVSTAVAMANQSSSAISVALTLRDRSGVSVASRLVDLAGKGHLARYVHELFPQMSTSAFEGSVTLESPLPVSGIALLFRRSSMTTLPLIALE